MSAVNSQLYIGTPNGIVLHAERGAGHAIRGWFYHAYSREEVPFENADQMIFRMEEFFDSIQYPHPSTNIRTFAETSKKSDKGRFDWAKGQLHTGTGRRLNKRERVMDDQELLSKHGDLGSFIIRVQHRQNSSMQGRLTWVDKNKTVFFRSAWEMIRLIDSALEETGQEQEDDLPSWEE
jgi:hypothetical protein